ncbi:MAG: histidine kinase [Armatimonadota bacterium]
MNIRPVLQSILGSTQEICLLACAAYLLSRTPVFARLLLYRASFLDKAKAFLFFALVSLVEVALPARFSPNSGIIASVTAGLLMGPLTGLGVGGLNWFLEAARGHGQLNGGVGACIGALVAGWASFFRPNPREQAVVGFMAGALSHAVWFTLSSLLSDVATIQTNSTLADLWELWRSFLPLVLASGVGVLAFLWILADLKAQQDRVASVQIERAFAIANRTLPFLRHGLTEESAQHIVQVIRSVADLGAVAITDGQRVLAHVGAGADHHRPGDALPGGPTALALETGTSQVLHSRADIGCQHPNCPLSSGVVAPLFHDERIIGCVHLYGAEGRPVSKDVVGLAVGIAQFLSRYQMELAELERQTQAASQAELKALQAQVHPHFLFNVLNTLAALSEIDPPSARKLVVRLGDFMRRSLRESPPPLIPLEDELENVHSYLDIEKMRFGSGLTVVERIDDGLAQALVPSFGLQILAENAVLHGISQKPGGGTVAIRAAERRGGLWLCVADDGPGMSRELAQTVLEASQSGRVGGLAVLYERCRRIYGTTFRMRVLSKPGVGTVVLLRVPLEYAGTAQPQQRQDGCRFRQHTPRLPAGVKIQTRTRMT